MIVEYCIIKKEWQLERRMSGAAARTGTVKKKQNKGSKDSKRKMEESPRT